MTIKYLTPGVLDAASNMLERKIIQMPNKSKFGDDGFYNNELLSAIFNCIMIKTCNPLRTGCKRSKIDKEILEIGPDERWKKYL